MKIDHHIPKDLGTKIDKEAKHPKWKSNQGIQSIPVKI